VRHRAGLPRLPTGIRRLPVDARGYPIPWFVAVLPDGTRDFRVIEPGKIVRAVKERLCWICGRPRRRDQFTFMIGPMCAVNRVSSEPPSHHKCAQLAAMACPFLTLPMAKRRDHNLPEGGVAPAGLALARNPGVTLLWQCGAFKAMRVEAHESEGIRAGVLFRIGDPLSVEWYAEGRPATRAEVLASIDSGMPLLAEPAEREGGHAPYVLAAQRAAVDRLLPEAG